MVSIKNIRASLARLISPPGLPTVTIPDIGRPAPGIVAQTSAAPVAGELVRGNPQDLAETIRAVATLRRATPTVRAQAVAARAAATRPARPAPRAADDDAPQPDTSGLDSVIKSLMDSVEQLRKMLPADVDADDGDLATAKAYLAIGNKKEALACISRAHTAVGAQVAALKSSNALRSQPSSRKRASALIRQGFDAQPVVANLDAMFHRPAARASMALAPVGGSAPARPAAVVPTSTAPDRSKLAALEAELKSVDDAMKKSFVYDNASIARQEQLTVQIRAERKKLLNRQ